jgi:hypothetical protein
MADLFRLMVSGFHIMNAWFIIDYAGASKGLKKEVASR